MFSLCFSLGLNLITIVPLNLLNILCLLLFVKSHPKITSIGSRNDLPKLSSAAFLVSTLLVVFIFKNLFPIDRPLVCSKYVQYPKNARLDGR